MHLLPEGRASVKQGGLAKQQSVVDGCSDDPTISGSVMQIKVICVAVSVKLPCTQTGKLGRCFCETASDVVIFILKLATDILMIL
jgi:hypothetical protein